MATIQDLENSKLEFATIETKSGTYGESKTTNYHIALPKGTTPEQAQKMLDEGLTSTNWFGLDDGVAVKQGKEGLEIVIPKDKLANIEPKEFAAFKLQYDSLKPTTPAAGAAKTSEPTAEEKEQTENVKRVIELQEKLQKDGKLSEPEKKELQDISAKLTDDEKKDLQDHHNNIKPKEEKAKSEASLNGYAEDHKDDKTPKTKAEIVADMFKSGDVMGAILAMIFMPDNNDKSKTVGQMLTETKDNVKSETPASEKKTKAAKEGEAAAKKDDKPKTPADLEYEEDVKALKYKRDAKNELATAEAELQKAQAEYDAVEGKYKDKYKDKYPDALTNDEKLEIKKAENVKEKAQGRVNAAANDIDSFPTSGEKEKDQKLKAAEAENAKLTEEKKNLEAKIKELEAKAVAIDKAVVADKQVLTDEVVRTKQKEFDALIEKRGSTFDDASRSAVNQELIKLLKTIPDSNFKDSLKDKGKEQDKQFEKLTTLLETRKEYKINIANGKDENIVGIEDEIKTLKVNGAKAMQNQNEQMQQDEIKANEAAKAAVAKATEAQRVATATKGVKDAIVGLDIGTNAGDDAIQTVNGVHKPDSKINYYEALHGNKKDLIDKVAALDGNAGDISKEDVQKFAAILNDLQTAKGVTDCAKEVLSAAVQPTVVQNNKAPEAGVGRKQ